MVYNNKQTHKQPMANGVRHTHTLKNLMAHAVLSKYPTWCRSIFLAMSSWSHCAFRYPSCSVIQENIIFHRTNNHFSLEVITQMGDVVLDFGTWECPFPFWASARVLDQEDWVMKHNTSRVMKHNSILQWCYVAHSSKEKLHERLRSFSSFPIIPTTSFLHDQCVLHRY
jgi:hypothetical protein